MYFLGFPYGQLFSDMKFEKTGERVSFPFVKKAIWSASSPAGDGSVIFPDGHSNRGFSGGPVVFCAYDQPGYVMKIAGVVSGYKPNLEIVLQPTKVKPNKDLHNVDPWRIITIKGEKFV